MYSVDWMFLASECLTRNSSTRKRTWSLVFFNQTNTNDPISTFEISMVHLMVRFSHLIRHVYFPENDEVAGKSHAALLQPQTSRRTLTAPALIDV